MAVIDPYDRSSTDALSDQLSVGAIGRGSWRSIASLGLAIALLWAPGYTTAAVRAENGSSAATIDLAAASAATEVRPPRASAASVSGSCPQPAVSARRHIDTGITRTFLCPDRVTGATRNVTAYGATANDPGNDDALAIQAAIGAARAGDVVYLPAGTYHLKSGPIRLKSGVSVRGQSTDSVVLATMYPSSLEAVLLLGGGGSNLTVSDLTIRSVAGTYDAGLRLGSGRWDTNNSGATIVTRIVIERLLIEGHRRFGITLENSQYVLIRDNTIRYATALGSGGMGYGISINFDRSSQNWITGNRVGPTIRHAYLLAYRANHNLLENNTATGTTQDAFDLHGEDEYSNELRGNTVTDCVWTDPTTGVLTYPSGFGVGEVPSGPGGGMAYHDVSGPYNWIHHNAVSGCYTGVRVNNTNRTDIDDNVVHDNAVGISAGDLRSANLSRIRRNNVFNNGTGIYLGEADDTLVRRNISSSNLSRGLVVRSGADRYRIKYNDFRWNGHAVQLISSNGIYKRNVE